MVKITELETELARLQECIDTRKERTAAAQQTVKKYEREMETIKGSRDSQLKDLEQQMNALKKKANASAKELKTKQQEKEEINQEYADLKNEFESLEQDITTVNLSKLEQELAEKEEILHSERVCAWKIFSHFNSQLMDGLP